VVIDNLKQQKHVYFLINVICVSVIIAVNFVYIFLFEGQICVYLKSLYQLDLIFSDFELCEKVFEEIIIIY